MAKSDFCFTYYDGDAASDMQHMNRLERGAYTDLILFQRKIKGPFTIDQARKFLSRDFDSVWPSMELILKVTDDGRYFIEWLFKSEEKAKKHSEFQSEKRKGKTKQEPNDNQTQTESKPDLTKHKPLGDRDGNRDEDEKKGVQGENENPDRPLSDLGWALDEIYLGAQRMKPVWQRIDFDRELETFREKVRGSPDKYRDHDTDGIRLAFQSHLRNAKPITPQHATNQKNTRSAQQINADKQYSGRL